MEATKDSAELLKEWSPAMRDVMRKTYEKRLAEIPSRDSHRLETRLGPVTVSYSVDYLDIAGEINYVGHRHYLNFSVRYEGTWNLRDLMDFTLFDFITGEVSKTADENKFLRAHGKYLLDLSLEYIDRHPAIRRQAMRKHLSMTLHNGLELIGSDNFNFWSELDVTESGLRLANRIELAEAIAKVRAAAIEARELLRRAKSPRARAAA